MDRCIVDERSIWWLRTSFASKLRVFFHWTTFSFNFQKEKTINRARETKKFVIERWRGTEKKEQQQHTFNREKKEKVKRSWLLGLNTHTSHTGNVFVRASWAVRRMQKWWSIKSQKAAHEPKRQWDWWEKHCNDSHLMYEIYSSLLCQFNVRHCWQAFDSATFRERIWPKRHCRISARQRSQYSFERRWRLVPITQVSSIIKKAKKCNSTSCCEL